MRRRGSFLRWVERSLLAAGVLLTAYFVLVQVEVALVRWTFERELESSIDEAVSDGARDAIDHGTAESRGTAGDGSRLEDQSPFDATPSTGPPEPGSLIGELTIPRVGLSEIILEGIQSRTLRRAVGHIPGTALPGGGGNVGLAGHRDRAFRRLKDLRAGDLVVVRTKACSLYYRVDSLSVVDPMDAHLLLPSSEPMLTLVTCYPFYFVGMAPQRFVAQARGIAPDGLAPGNRQPEEPSRQALALAPRDGVTPVSDP